MEKKKFNKNYIWVLPRFHGNKTPNPSKQTPQHDQQNQIQWILSNNCAHLSRISSGYHSKCLNLKKIKAKRSKKVKDYYQWSLNSKTPMSIWRPFNWLLHLPLFSYNRKFQVKPRIKINSKTLSTISDQKFFKTQFSNQIQKDIIQKLATSIRNQNPN